MIENKTDQRNQSQPELFVYLTDSWAPGVSALFQLDSTSAELFYGLLLQKGKGQKDLFLFLVIEFAQFCLLSRTALVPLTVIHWLLSIFQWTKWRLKKKKNGDFFSTFILENKHFKIIFFLRSNSLLWMPTLKPQVNVPSKPQHEALSNLKNKF